MQLRHVAVPFGAFVLWTIVALALTTQTYAIAAMNGDALRWSSILPYALLEWYSWGLLAAAIFRIARAGRARGFGAAATAAMHVSAAIAIGTLQPAILAAAKSAIVYGALDARAVPLFRLLWLHKFPVNLGIYALIAIAERVLRASRLEALLAESEIAVLKLQLQPHFLYNVLNSIAALVDEDPVQAKRMIARVGDFLRVAASDARKADSSLEEELRLLRRYIEIEHVRFQDRLEVAFEVAAEALDARVPSLLLQPLVENAVKHGVARCEGPGRITIRARRLDDIVELEIEDGGHGAPATLVEGTGLTNTRARLHAHYGGRARLAFESRPARGLSVRVTIPYQTEARA